MSQTDSTWGKLILFLIKVGPDTEKQGQNFKTTTPRTSLFPGSATLSFPISLSPQKQFRGLSVLIPPRIFPLIQQVPSLSMGCCSFGKQHRVLSSTPGYSVNICHGPLCGLQGNTCSTMVSSIVLRWISAPAPGAPPPSPFLTLELRGCFSLIFPLLLCLSDVSAFSQLCFPRGSTSFTNWLSCGCSGGTVDLAGASCTWHWAAPDLLSEAGL